jgi:hypothetical protein
MIRFRILAVMILSIGMTSGLQADQKTEVKDAAPPAVKPETKPAAPGVLTDEKLKEMLEAIGFDVREEKSSDGSFTFWIKKSVSGLTYEVSVSISPNKEKIWTTTTLADIAEAQLKMSERWVKLLELNDDIGPSYFRYNAKYKKIYMSRSTDNRAVTAKALREHLERMLDRCAENKEHWMAEKWTAAQAVAAPATVDKGK